MYINSNCQNLETIKNKKLNPSPYKVSFSIPKKNTGGRKSDMLMSMRQVILDSEAKEITVNSSLMYSNISACSPMDLQESTSQTLEDAK